MYQRIEGNTSVPDVFVCNPKKWYWVEVKVYRGRKSMEAFDFNANDLDWKPGQLRFRNDMINAGRKQNYMLIVFTEEGCMKTFKGGLDRV